MAEGNVGGGTLASVLSSNSGGSSSQESCSPSNRYERSRCSGELPSRYGESAGPEDSVHSENAGRCGDSPGRHHDAFGSPAGGEAYGRTGRFERLDRVEQTAQAGLSARRNPHSHERQAVRRQDEGGHTDGSINSYTVTDVVQTAATPPSPDAEPHSPRRSLGESFQDGDSFGGHRGVTVKDGKGTIAERYK